MTTDSFFDEIVSLYNNAAKVSTSFRRANIHRSRQHSISSLSEDLLAAYLFDNLRGLFQDIKLHFMVDYAIQPDNIGAKLMPDIAIIVEKENPIIVSYIDLKTDLGFKREYFERLPKISENILRIREAEFIGPKTQEGNPISPSKTIIWRTVVISDTNIPKILLKRNKSEAERWEEVFKLYFLSGDKHPNAKDRGNIKIYEGVFNMLLNDIQKDIQNAIDTPNAGK